MNAKELSFEGWEWRRPNPETYRRDDFIEISVEDGKVLVSLGEDDYEVHGSVWLNSAEAQECASRLTDAARAIEEPT